MPIVTTIAPTYEDLRIRGKVRRGIHLERATKYVVRDMPYIGKCRVGSGVERLRFDDGRFTAWFDTSLASQVDAMLLEARVEFRAVVSIVDYHRLTDRLNRDAVKAARARKRALLKTNAATKRAATKSARTTTRTKATP